MRGLVVGMVAALAGAAAPWAAAGAAEFSHLRAMAGAYTNEVLADPVLDAELRQNLGAGGYESLMQSLEVVVPSELVDDRFLIMSGCMQHACGVNDAVIVVDLELGGVQVLRREGFGPSFLLSPAAQAAVNNAMP
jgi:hypothetical protein